MVKTCSQCGVEKPLDAFYKRSESGRYRYSCKVCTNSRTMFRYHNVEGVKETHRKASRKSSLKQYGLSLDDVKALLGSQDNSCAICGKELSISDEMKNISKIACVDHCHKTGVVRGVLCRSCNSGIGYLKDDLETVRSALRYLEKSYG